MVWERSIAYKTVEAILPAGEVIPCPARRTDIDFYFLFLVLFDIRTDEHYAAGVLEFLSAILDNCLDIPRLDRAC